MVDITQHSKVVANMIVQRLARSQKARLKLASKILRGKKRILPYLYIPTDFSVKNRITLTDYNLILGIGF